MGADLDAGTITADEYRLPDRCGDQSDRSVAIEHQNPGLGIGKQRPARAFGKINSLQNEMLVRNQDRPSTAEAR